MLHTFEYARDPINLYMQWYLQPSELYELGQIQQPVSQAPISLKLKAALTACFFPFSTNKCVLNN